MGLVALVPIPGLKLIAKVAIIVDKVATKGVHGIVKNVKKMLKSQEI
jgi:hypothetical protein